MIEEIDDLIPKLMEEYKVPGIAIALIEDFQVSLLKSFGHSNLEKRKSVAENTVFQIASISKVVTVWGVMLLVEKDLVSLDDPIENYLTRWHLPPSDFDRKEVTIKRLLSHTAGLSLHGYQGYPPDIQLPSIEDSLSGNTNYQRDEIQKKYKEKYASEVDYDYDYVSIIMKPGSKFKYSGGGYTFLQLLIEEVTGKSFAGYMEEEVLQPLGMKNSSFTWRQDLKPLTAIAYDDDGETPVPNYFYTALAAAGCYSTIVDLTTFTMAGMRGSHEEMPGRGILKPETVQTMYSKVIEAEKQMEFDTNIGLGYFLTPYKGINVVSHSGGNIGWNSMMLFIPKSGDGLVALTNCSNGTLLIQQLILKWNEYLTKNFF